MYKFIKHCLTARKNKGKYPGVENLRCRFTNKKKVPDVLVYGDSVALRVSRHDSDKRDLASLLAEDFKKCELEATQVTQSAYHLGVFEALSNALLLMPNKPKAVVVPINMRSFSPQWQCNPKWQYQDVCEEALCFMRKQSGAETILSKGVSNLDLVEYDKILVEYPLVNCRTIGEFRSWINSNPKSKDGKKERLKMIFIYHYLHLLQVDNERVSSLKRMVSYFENKDIFCLFYITPVNYLAGVHLVGEAFSEFFDYNLSVVLESVNGLATDKSNISIINLSKEMDSSYFFHDFSPTEHLNQYGRRFVSQRIVQCVVEMMGDVSNL